MRHVFPRGPDEGRANVATMPRKREFVEYTRDVVNQDPSEGEDDVMDTEGLNDKAQGAEGRPICTSCEQCQLRKGKCDRGQPVCGWCAANGKICEYKERKKPGLRAGYGRNLERRLDMVEERLEAQARTIEQLEAARSLPQLTTTYVASSNPTPSPVPVHRGSLSSVTTPQIYGSARSRSHSNLFATSWTESPQASIHEASFSEPHGTLLSPAVPEDINNVEAAQAFSGDPDLPPADMLFSLVDLYFLHINQWFPLLERATTMERLFGATPWTASDRILLHSITATTIRFSTDQRLDDQTRRQYHERSRQKVLLYGMENFSVGALKALMLLALNYIGSRTGGPGLNLLALISRSVVQLGLCKEADSNPVLPAYSSNSTLGISVLPTPRDWIEDEGRRRLFWLAYILDRDATVATAFDFSLDEKDINRKLPCKDELFVRNKAVETRWFQSADRNNYSIADPGTLGSFSYLIELKGLMTKIHLYLKRPVDITAAKDVDEWQKMYRQLDLSLREWRQNLPGEFRSLEWIKNSGRNARQVDCGWILLQATFYTVCIRLHSAAAYPPHKSPIFTPSYSAAQSCYQETESIITLARYAVEAGLLSQLGPPFAFCLWVGARVLLVHGSTVEKQVSPNVYFLIDLLRQIGRWWPIATRYAKILQKVMEDYQEGQNAGSVSASAASPGISNLGSSVSILADMRRTAYDIELLITNHHGEPNQAGMPTSGVHQQLAHRQYSQHSQQQLTPSSATLPPNWWSRSNSQPSPATVPNYSTELEYLEAFDFFNYPRASGNVTTTPAPGVPNQAISLIDAQQVEKEHLSMNVNIDQFSIDPSSDWLVGKVGKPGSATW